MLGFAALAVARWVSSPLVNRVDVPENANQAVEAQSIPLDHQAGETENISTPPVVDLVWYKDGKKVAGAAAGAMALAGISVLAYGQLADQEGMCPWTRKGLIPPAPFERPLLSNSGIDDPFLQEKLAGSAAAKNFIKYLPSNHALFWNQFLGTSPALSVMQEEELVAADFVAETESFLEIEKGLVSQSRDDLENSSNRVNNNIINPQPLLQADPLPPAAKRYKLCQGVSPETSRLQGCKSVKNPDTVVLQGDQRLCEISSTTHSDGRKTWRPLNCTTGSSGVSIEEKRPIDAKEFLEGLEAFLSREEEQRKRVEEGLEDSKVHVGVIMNPQWLLTGNSTQLL